MDKNKALIRIWWNWNPYTLLEKVKQCSCFENSLAIPEKSYTWVILVNKTVLYIQKLLRELIIKVLIIREEIS